MSLNGIFKHLISTCVVFPYKIKYFLLRLYKKKAKNIFSIYLIRPHPIVSLPMKNPPILSQLLATKADKNTFTNPLLSEGADPWCFYKDGFYYYTHTTAHNITLWKTTCISKLVSAEKIIIYTPATTGLCSKNLWAPEIHFLQDKWYIYFAADCGDNNNHRMWVLENESPDPMIGNWKMKGKLLTPQDKWCIDGTIFEHKQQLYFLWSGWHGNLNGQQNIYIAKMKNPWTIQGKRTILSSPQLAWETIGPLKDAINPPHVKVNEGPVILRNENKLYLIYSASGCWTDFYALGMLTASADCNPMLPASWVKTAEPVFKQSKQNKVYSTGHCSFFKSPDGIEDYILYHAKSIKNDGCGRTKAPRAQKFIWNEDGSPNFGIPVKAGERLNLPSNTII